MIDGTETNVLGAYQQSNADDNDELNPGSDSANAAPDGLSGLLGDAEIAEPTNASNASEEGADDDQRLLDKLKAKVKGAIGRDETA